MRPLFLALLVSMSFAGSLAAQDAEIDLVGQPEWDFGLLEQGEQRERVFTLENPGQAELDISKIGVTCGCVRVEPIRGTIPAGGSLRFTAYLDTTRVSGKIAKSIFIESNAPRRRRLEIAVRGEIVPLWWLESRAVNFGEIEKGAGAERMVRLLVRPGRELALKRVTASTPFITHEVKPFGEPGDEEHGYEIRLRLAPETPAGRPLRAHVTCEVDSEHKPSAFVTVHADVKGPFEIRPTRIPFGAVRKGQTVTQGVGIRKRKGGGLVIEEVFCSDPQVTWNIVEITKGETYRIDFTLAPDGKRTQIAGFVHVKTNVEGQRIIKLPYRAAVRP